VLQIIAQQKDNFSFIVNDKDAFHDN